MDDGALGKALTGITHVVFGMRQSAFRSPYEGSSSVDGDGAVDSTMAELRLRHYLTNRLSAGFAIPTGFVRFDPGGGAAVQRASGFGDIELQGRYLLKRGVGYGLSIDLEGSLSLPTGESTLSIAQEGATTPPNILSLGRGAFGLRTRLGLSKFLRKNVALRGWAGASAPLSANSNNITFGTQFTGGVGASYLASPTWTVAPQLSASYVTHARSTVNGELINSGGAWLHGEVIASWRASDDVSLSAIGRVPLYRNVNGTQLTESLTGMLQLSYRFGAEDEEEHEHGEGDEHDHGDEHEDHGDTHEGHGDTHEGHGDTHEGHGDAHEGHGDTHEGHGDAHEGHGDAHEGHGDTHEGHGDAHEGHGDAHEGHGDTHGHQTHMGDVLDAAVGGATFDPANIAVLGKVTVVDFWAEWCGPCKPLTRGLEELAASNLSVAVRKVEVPSFDTAVAKQHLKNAKGLPMVWIYDTSGKRVHTLVQKNLEQVTEAVHSELARTKK